MIFETVLGIVASVTEWRRLIRAYPALAMLLVMAVLIARIVVPAGYMLVTGKDGSLSIQVCSGLQEPPMAMELPMPHPPTGHGDHQKPAKAEMPCAFAIAAMPMISGADPLLLGLAIAFVMALAIWLAPLRLQRRTSYLRPPLRGPPATA